MFSYLSASISALRCKLVDRPADQGGNVPSASAQMSLTLAHSAITGCCRLSYTPGSGTLFRSAGSAFRALVLCVLLLATPLQAVGANPHSFNPVRNTAFLNFGSGTSQLISNTVEVVPRSVASIEFLKYAPRKESGGEMVHVPPTDYDQGGNRFTAVMPILDQTLPLLGSPNYYPGETIYVRLTDLDQNLNTAHADKILVSVTCSETGDSEVLRLTETGFDTGIFAGYLPTATDAESMGANGALLVKDSCHLQASYTDPLDQIQTVTDAALIDPYGFVFDSVTGVPLNGATVTLFDVATNSPATVYGNDGVSRYPAELLTGSTVVDASGLRYPLPPGGFRFPYIIPGSYRLLVTTPNGYVVPSKTDDAKLQEVRPGSVVTVGSRGETFEVDPGPALRLDIPADPLYSGLWLQKLVSDEQASVGDFLQYQLILENTGEQFTSSAVRIKDRLPLGFRYQAGSAHLDGTQINDPDITADGRIMTFQLGDLPAKGRRTVTYVVEVATGARTGEAVNQAQAQDRSGALSNVARVSVEVTEVFFRDKTFLVGRMLNGSCHEDDTEMPGIAGVRIFLEDGSFVVTDRNGKYHFEGIEPGTHVMQVDLATLPPGFSMIDCKGANQSAGRSFSRFVDLQGGALWQVNFYAAPLGDSASRSSADDTTQHGPTSPEQKTASPVFADGLLSPLPGTAVNRIEEVRLRLDANLKARLSLDNREISEDRIGLRMLEPETGMILYSYIGIDFGPPGTHHLLIEGVDPFGNVRFRQEATLTRFGEIAGMRLLESADNRADGKTPIRIRLEIVDVLGQVLTSATSVVLESGELQPLGSLPSSLTADYETTRKEQRVHVDPQGWISFNSVDRSGLYPIRVIAGTSSLDIDVFVKPQMREWILVGFAEGTVGYNTISDNQVSAEEAGIDEHGYTDGQVRFFAKGAIKGEWLLTLAYDSDKPDLDGDSLQQIIDPDTYYPLYGDETQQGYEAASAENLYVKLERDQFYALFGDMQTNLTQTVLSQYSRTMNGFKSELRTEHFAYTVFAADTKQAFKKDEIRGDGTAGRYKLSQSGLVINSEKVVIETRDRFHNEQIVKEEPLSRYLDYDIDYDVGTLYFKRPVPSKDENLNPVFIVVHYETLASSEKNWNYGGRAAVKLFDQKLEVGGSLIHEENGTDDGDLYGTDVTVELTPQTTIHAEIATSDVDHIDGDDRNGNAYLAEVEHLGTNFDLRAWFRQQDGEFGLGQQNGGTEGMRTYGTLGSYQFNPHWRLAGEIYHEDNLDSDAERDVASLQGEYRTDRYSLSAGVREARDQFDDGERQTSRQMLLSGNWTTPDRSLTLHATHEQSLGGNDGNIDYPTRMMLGADYQLTRSVGLFAEQEFTWGEEEDTQGTRVGLKATPWRGGEVRTAVERESIENSERIFALFGVGQTWQVTTAWSVDLSIDRTQTIKNKLVGERVNPGAAPTSGHDYPNRAYRGNNDDFTAVSLGTAYRAADWSWWNRAEVRQGDSEDKVGVSSGLVKQLRQGLAASARLLIYLTDQDGTKRDEEELRLGLAYRPDHGRWIVLERLDLERDHARDGAGGEQTGWQVVNHLHASFRANRLWQTSIYYGCKYAREDFDLDRYDGFTDMLAAETRYALNHRWDLGANGAALHSWNSGQIDYSAGGSVGFQFATNSWVSVGYNMAGFEDDDFSAANYTAQGPYVCFRVKFDQQSVKDIMEWFTR